MMDGTNLKLTKSHTTLCPHRCIDKDTLLHRVRHFGLFARISEEVDPENLSLIRG